MRYVVRALRQASEVDVLENALRQLIEEVVRPVVREELRLALTGARPTNPEPAADDRYLSPKQAAQLMSVSADTVRKWVQQRKLRAYGAGRHIRVKEGELHAFMSRPSQGEEPVDVDAIARRILEKDATRCGS